MDKSILVKAMIIMRGGMRACLAFYRGIFLEAILK